MPLNHLCALPKFLLLLHILFGRWNELQQPQQLYTLQKHFFFWAQPRTTTKHNKTSPSTWCKISRNCRREISHLEHAEKKLETTAGAPGFHIIFVVLMVKKAGFQQRKDMNRYQHLLQKISLMSFDFTTLAKNQVLSPPKPHPWRIFGDQ